MEKPLFTRGRFVWNDLMAKDPARARTFYSELMAWTVEEVDMGPMGKYPMLKNKGVGLAGIMPLTGMPAEVPSHWVQYVSVDDVDAACAQAPKLGGKVVVPAFDIPNVGRTALLQDPGGAVLHAFKAAATGEMNAEKTQPEVGEFCWYEVLSTEVDKSRDFYAGIFGWTWEKMAMPGMDYWMAKRKGDVQVAGLMQKPADVPGRSHWLSYLAVDKLDGASARAETLGAKKMMGPQSIPKIGTFSVYIDPVGAAVALFEGAK